MMQCNLSVLLAERNLKITKIAKETGISRTTLTSLYYNYAKGIQFDTFNTLCSYLKITPDQLILFYPYDVEILSCEPINHIKPELDEFDVGIIITSTTQRSMRECHLRVFCDGYQSSASLTIGLWDTLDGEEELDNTYILNVFNKMPIEFKTTIGDDIVNTVLNDLLISRDLNYSSFDYNWESGL